MADQSDTDQDVQYLREVQYRDSTQVAKRANLHVAYRTAPQSGFDWFAPKAEWQPGQSVLDVGCGPGYLWEHIAAIAPEGLRLTLSDLSTGMVDEACARAVATGRFAAVEGRVADARELPFADGTFDVVVSTYALYHVPEPATAVAELARVVSDDGTVAIMTNGPGHLREIQDVRTSVFGERAAYDVNMTFAPALAAGLLIEHFDDVTWSRYDDTLLVTDVDDLLAFMTSSPPATEATSAQVEAMRTISLARMERGGGVFSVSKDTGALICRRRRGPRRTT